MSAEFVPHMFDRVQVRQQARPWKTSDVLLIFVFLDDASSEFLQCHLGAPCSGYLASPKGDLTPDSRI